MNNSPKPTRAKIDKAQAFLDLFAGYEKAKGYYMLGRKNDKGKMEGKALTLKKPVTLADWTAHLDGGEKGIGVIPLMADDRCAWGCIDIDIINIDHVELEKKIKAKDLPLIVARSKSGGAHLYHFQNEPQPAEAVQDALEAWAAALGYGGSEVFPKQTHRANEDDIGNWLNMPYYSVDAPHGTLRYAIKDGVPIDTAGEFLEFADEMKADAAALEIQIESGELFVDGPPCLIEIEEQGGFDEFRNEGMFSVGVYLRKRYPEEWRNKMMEYNGLLCTPPMETLRMSGLIKSFGKKEYAYKCKQPPLKSHCNRADCLKSKYGVGGSKRKKDDEQPDLYDLLGKGNELWHDDDKRAYATVGVDGVAQNYSIESKSFKQWLASQYYEFTGKALGSEQATKLITLAAGQAKFRGDCHKEWLRVAENDGKLYLDLGDENWTVIEIDAEGWRPIANPPVRFRRAAGRPLPMPLPGGGCRSAAASYQSYER